MGYRNDDALQSIGNAAGKGDLNDDKGTFKAVEGVQEQLYLCKNTRRSISTGKRMELTSFAESGDLNLLVGDVVQGTRDKT